MEIFIIGVISVYLIYRYFSKRRKCIKCGSSNITKKYPTKKVYDGEYYRYSKKAFYVCNKCNFADYSEQEK